MHLGSKVARGSPLGGFGGHRETHELECRGKIGSDAERGKGALELSEIDSSRELAAEQTLQRKPSCTRQRRESDASAIVDAHCLETLTDSAPDRHHCIMAK